MSTRMLDDPVRDDHLRSYAPLIAQQKTPPVKPAALTMIPGAEHRSRIPGAGSDAAVPEIVVALDVHRQERAIAAPAFVFRQLDLLLGVGVALAFRHRLL